MEFKFLCTIFPLSGSIAGASASAGVGATCYRTAAAAIQGIGVLPEDQYCPECICALKALNYSSIRSIFVFDLKELFEPLHVLVQLSL
jgi:hypothetical protein